MKAPTKVTVLIDDREKKPLLFPASFVWHPNRAAHSGQLVQLQRRVETMPEGDYALEGYEHKAIVERKGSVWELTQNFLTKDWARASYAFERLADATEVPYLLLDGGPANFWKKDEYSEPERAFDALCELMVRLGIRLWYGGYNYRTGPRRVLGEQVVRVLMAHAYHQEIEEAEIDVAKILGDQS